MSEILFVRLDEFNALVASLPGLYQPLDATLTALAGLGSGADKLPYFTGVDTAAETTLTAFMRTVLDDVDAATARATLGAQTLDATLTALAALDSSTGFVTETAADTFTKRSLAAPVAGFTINNPAGVAGNPTFVLANDLAALEGLSTNGIIVRTATDTMTTRSIAAGTAIGVTDGDGVAGNPTVAVTDAELVAIAGLTSAADRLPYFTGSGTASLATFTSYARTLVDDVDAATARGTLGLTIGTNVQAFDAQLFSNIPQNSQSAAYTAVSTDAQKHIFHPSSDNNARTFTIPANASVAYPVGTAITFVNKINTVTIAINSDTLTFAGVGTTGSRTLAANGMATAIKIASTEWMISGSGLT